MSNIDSLVQIGYYKGEMDFGVKGTVAELTIEEMNELRIMTMVAVAQAENMWRTAQEKKEENKASEAINPLDNLEPNTELSENEQ